MLEEFGSTLRRALKRGTPEPSLLVTNPTNNPYCDPELAGGDGMLATRRVALNVQKFDGRDIIAQRAENLRQLAEDAVITASYRDISARRLCHALPIRTFLIVQLY